jgi:hypothetical protein
MSNVWYCQIKGCNARLKWNDLKYCNIIMQEFHYFDYEVEGIRKVACKKCYDKYINASKDSNHDAKLSVKQDNQESIQEV